MNSQTVTRGHGFLEGFLAKQRSKRANKLIPGELRAGRILDIGCGTYPYFLMETQFNGKYGLDQSEAAADHRDPANGLHLRQLDFGRESALPFEDNFFSVVTMLAVFEHIEPEQLCRLVAEIHRVLVPGGIYILTTPAWWTDGLLRFMAALRLVSPVEIADHKDTYSHKKITRILEGCGFRWEHIRLGYFEAFMNIWTVARKGEEKANG